MSELDWGPCLECGTTDRRCTDIYYAADGEDRCCQKCDHEYLGPPPDEQDRVSAWERQHRAWQQGNQP